MSNPDPRLIVFAPNWLGDAVMALPSLTAVGRHYPGATIAVAARRHVAPLFEMVPRVQEIVRLEPAGRLGGWFAASRDARRLCEPIRSGEPGARRQQPRFDVAILLPNSFRTAWLAARARIPERWGYATDGRSRLLTRGVERVHGVHQVEYYQRLLEALGIAANRGKAPHDAITPLPSAEARARDMLAARGWAPGECLVGMAPGAAYGTAKQWPPERFARLAAQLAAGSPGQPPARTVIVGSEGDRATCDRVEREINERVPPPSGRCINLAGATDLCELAAVAAHCRSFVSNDSGAMHLAAAAGVPVTAVFGPTREWETAPLAFTSAGATRESQPIEHAVVTTEVWCRPCMLRECPIDHACMTGIEVERVKEEVLKQLRRGEPA